MKGYSRPFKLSISWGPRREKWPSSFASAEARQTRLEAIRLMDADLYETLERELGPPLIETWEVFEPEVTVHDPGLYRPPRAKA